MIVSITRDVNVNLVEPGDLKLAHIAVAERADVKAPRAARWRPISGTRPDPSAMNGE